MIRLAPALMPTVALIDLLNRVADGADELAAQGWLYDPDDPGGWRMISVETAAELAVLAAECRECRRGPSALAQHWLNRAQVKYILSQPDLKCPCGAVYKANGEPGHSEEFYTVINDGTGYDWAGAIRVDSKGEVTHSDDCPGCGRSFAATVSLQNGLPMPRAQPRKKTAAEVTDASQEALFGVQDDPPAHGGQPTRKTPAKVPGVTQGALW